MGIGTDLGRGGNATGVGVEGSESPAYAAYSGPGKIQYLVYHIYFIIDC